MNTRRKLALRAPSSHALAMGVAFFMLALAAVWAVTFAPAQASLAGDAPKAAQVIHSIKNDVSAPLGALHPDKAGPAKQAVPVAPPAAAQDAAGKDQDSAIQSVFGPLAMPAPDLSWTGLTPFARPADANGDVGPNNYVQVVNYYFQAWTKAGESVAGPLRLSQIWDGFGGPCASIDQAFDPVVLYDALADRWFLGGAYARRASDPAPPAGICIAVSTSGDPAGTWARYQFELSTGSAELWYDLPRWAVWSDGYYMAARVVSASGQGNIPFVFSRADMLAGQPATVQRLTPPTALRDTLPVDFDGATLPHGPAYYVEFPGDVGGALAARLWKAQVNWNDPAQSRFVLAASVEVPQFQPLNCPAAGCIPQPATARKLYTRPDTLLYRASYRKNGDQESLLFAHPAKGASGQAAIRWYEVRGLATTPTLYQAGTFAPTSANRWAGSLAMDGSGNIALAYNVGSNDIYPSVRYAGRLAGDAPDELPLNEVTLADGQSPQVNSVLWSDYSNLAVDPADNCTFWYSAPYIDEAGNAHTGVGSFHFPSCVATAPPIPFKDVPADSYFDVPVYELFAKGAISGYSGAPCGAASPCFLPFNNITRGQATKIIALAANYAPNQNGWTFQDVPPDNAFYPYVQALASAGVIGGYPCGSPGEECGPAQRPYFRPNNPVTRGQLTKIVALAYSIAAGAGDPLFADVPAASPFFGYVQALAARGAINGYNCGGNELEPCVGPANLPYFRPGNSITRGQGAKVIYLTGRSGVVEPTATPTRDVSATPTLTGDNWIADYYSDTELYHFCAEESINTPMLDLNWATGRPAAACPTDNFSARVTRSVLFAADTYTFTFDHDDGVRFYVDGNLALDEWNSHQTDTRQIRLSAGMHDLRIEYNEQAGLAYLRVSWVAQHPTATPTSTQTPVPHGTATPTALSDSWLADYYADTTLTIPCGQQQITDDFLDLDWGEGAPLPACPSDDFSARFQRQVDFAGGNYSLITSHDGGARLFIDGQPVFDNWGADGVDTVVTSLSGGLHAVRIEMNETSGAARLHFHWGLAPTATPTAGPDQWVASFYSDRNFATLCAEQIFPGPFLQVDWGYNPPAEHCPADNFSARFTTQPDLAAGSYGFVLGHDDGARLYVDDQLVIDNWDTSGNDVVSLDLTAGPHLIRAELQEFGGAAAIDLSYSVLPQQTVTPTSDKWQGEYFARPDLTVLCAQEAFSDQFVDREWSGIPIAGCPVVDYSAMFVRRVEFAGGNYSFHVNHDDGARLFVDGVAILNQWNGPGDDTETATIDAGSHIVRIEVVNTYNIGYLHASWTRLGSDGVMPDK